MAHFCKKLQADCRRGWMLALTAMLIVFAPAAFAQSAPTVTGTVTDQSGQPVIGATIIEQGTTNGATTGVDGSYSLKLRGGGNSANLIFQSLGFVSQTVAVNGRTKIDVKLAEDAVALDAVVAIGYGTVKQKDLTTAVSVVKTDDLARRPITSASGALQGKAAGVQVIQPNGSPGQGMVVRVRGASSISSSNDPLYVVDGVPVGEGNYAIAYLSPNEIESMQVLKDASSAAIYGSRAANGVVLITTKQGSRSCGTSLWRYAAARRSGTALCWPPTILPSHMASRPVWQSGRPDSAVPIWSCCPRIWGNISASARWHGKFMRTIPTKSSPSAWMKTGWTSPAA